MRKKKNVVNSVADCGESDLGSRKRGEERLIPDQLFCLVDFFSVALSWVWWS